MSSGSWPAAVAVATLTSALAVAEPSAAAPTKAACVEANERAQDERKQGALLQARESLAVCLATSCPDPVRQDCADRLKEVDAATPTVVLAATDAAGNDLSEASVSVDGRLLAQRLDGTAVAIDPGAHRFLFESKGLAPEEAIVVVREDEKARPVRVVLGLSRPDPAILRRVAGIALGGAGAATGIAGLLLAVAAKSTYDHALAAECGGAPNGCSAQGARDGQTAHAEAVASTATLIAGGGLLATGVVLYLTAPAPVGVRLRPSVGSRSAGLEVAGAW